MKRTLLLITSAALISAPAIAQELPGNGAPPGECFTPVIVPAKTETPAVKTTARFTAKTEWRQVLCEANASPAVIRAIQTALQQEFLYSGPVDGRLSIKTYASISRFQKARGFATGGVTLKTIDALGVDWRSIHDRDAADSVTADGFSVLANGNVVDTDGTIIGQVNANGEVVKDGVVIGRLR